MGNVKDITKKEFLAVRYALMTVTETITISHVGRFIADNVQSDEPLAERVHTLLRSFAEEHNLGFVAADSGLIFVLYEKPFFSAIDAGLFLHAKMAA